MFTIWTVSTGQKHVQRLFRFIFANLGIAQKLTLVLAYHCKAKNCSFQNGENLVGRFEVMFSSGPWFSFSVHSGIHVNFHSFPLIGALVVLLGQRSLVVCCMSPRQASCFDCVSMTLSMPFLKLCFKSINVKMFSMYNAYRTWAWQVWLKTYETGRTWSPFCHLVSLSLTETAHQLCHACYVM